MNKIREAIIFATLKHAGQVRKGTTIPYIVHPVEVMQILTANGCNEKVIIAGLLHDTLEDTNTKEAEIKELFGNEVLRIVQSESEDKTKSWKERKQHTIDSLKTDSIETLLVCCADKLSNIRSIKADIELIGEKIWDRFNATKEQSAWYYKSIVGALRYQLKDCNMFKEFEETVNEVFVVKYDV